MPRKTFMMTRRFLFDDHFCYCPLTENGDVKKQTMLGVDDRRGKNYRGAGMRLK